VIIDEINDILKHNKNIDFETDDLFKSK